MIIDGITHCPVCGGILKNYDNVLRIVRTKRRVTKKVKIKRVRCTVCRKIHRQLPDFICPFKQYELDIITGVREGLITSDTIGFEDYPCEATMRIWLRENYK